MGSVKAWDYLRQLSELPPRGAGTAGERRAAAWLRERLEELGYEVEEQSFDAPRRTLYYGPAALAGVFIVAVALARAAPGAALALAAAGLVPMIGELLGGRVNFNLILPKDASQNVYATRPAGAVGDPGDVAGPVQDVVVVAHYDAQWGSWLFAPSFRPFLQPFFYVTYGGFVVALGAIAARWVAPDGALADGLAAAAFALLALTGGFLLLSAWTGRTVPGANDNGSGVAVALALADDWAEGPPAGGEGLRVSFLFTGAEEVGLRGMHRFMASERRDGLRPDTIFINIDNVGGGRLRYLLGEGMLAYEHYDEGLVAVAGRVAEDSDPDVLPLKNLLLPTDGLLPAKAGYPTITFLATEGDGSIPNYHWHTDTFANASRSAVDQTERFVKRFLLSLAQRVDGRRGRVG